MRLDWSRCKTSSVKMVKKWKRNLHEKVLKTRELPLQVLSLCFKKRGWQLKFKWFYFITDNSSTIGPFSSVWLNKIKSPGPSMQPSSPQIMSLPNFWFAFSGQLLLIWQIGVEMWTMFTGESCGSPTWKMENLICFEII